MNYKNFSLQQEIKKRVQMEDNARWAIKPTDSQIIERAEHYIQQGRRYLQEKKIK